MRRQKMYGRKDKKIFSKTADNVHSENFRFLRPMRGGYRA